MQRVDVLSVADVPGSFVKGREVVDLGHEHRRRLRRPGESGSLWRTFLHLYQRWRGRKQRRSQFVHRAQGQSALCEREGKVHVDHTHSSQDHGMCMWKAQRKGEERALAIRWASLSDEIVLALAQILSLVG